MKTTAEQRFWSQVRKTKKCWNWCGSKMGLGYGRIFVKGKSIVAHRFSYMLLKGSIRKGLELDHLCRNKKCVNPSHLEAVSHKENCLRGRSFTAFHAAKKYCKRGHKFNSKNTRMIVHKNRLSPARNCKLCAKITNKRWRDKNPEKIRGIRNKQALKKRKPK